MSRLKCICRSLYGSLKKRLKDKGKRRRLLRLALFVALSLLARELGWVEASHLVGVALFAEDKESKTEEPSYKKLQDARKKGQIAKSQDFNAAMTLILLTFFLAVLLETVFKQFAQMMTYTFTLDFSQAAQAGNVGPLMVNYIWWGMRIVTPFFLIMVVLAIVTNLFQTRFLFSTHPLKPDIGRLNPIKGFKNMFSQKSLVGLIKNLAKFALVGFVAFTTVRGMLGRIANTVHMDTQALFPFFLDLLSTLLLNVSIFMLGIGGIDFLYQRYDYRKGLRMTKQEVKDEYKNMEGDPQVRSFRRQKQQEIASARQLLDVPEATAVITNPTHYALAVRYETGVDEAPLLLAKGQNHIAQKIKDLAKEHGVPVVENKPLARLMYKEVEVGEVVPVKMYQAMAQVLAAIYKEEDKKKKKRK